MRTWEAQLCRFHLSRMILIFILLLACIPYAQQSGKELLSAVTEERMYNGTVVQYEEYPYFARIISNGSGCSGAIIDHDWVMTAAHCVSKEMNDPSSTFFMFGPGVENGFDGKKVPVHQIFAPPVVSEDTTYELERDYALLKLYEHDREIDGFLSLPAPDLNPGYIGTHQRVTILAGGITIHVNGTAFNDTDWLMKKVDTDVTSIRCSMDGYFPQSPIFIVCAVSYPAHPAEGFRTCSGDSGGPVFIRSNGSHYLTAVHSGSWHSCQFGFDHYSLGWKSTSRLVRISLHMSHILHTIDMHSQGHRQLEVMELWMVYPDMLPSHFTSI